MPRIPYADVSATTDREILGCLEDARLHGTQRPESQAVRASVPLDIHHHEVLPGTDGGFAVEDTRR
jgi:hypothetical protein